MTKSPASGLFTSTPWQRRKRVSRKRLSLATRAALIFMVCAAAAVASPALSISFTSIATFNNTDGANPGYGALVRGADGNFYGTTIFGGANGQGTFFKVTPAGRLTTLYSFCAEVNCTDGASPNAGLVLGRDGSYYGTTSGGGAYLYYGTVFKITPAGAPTILHSFQGYPDGEAPVAGLVQDSDGNFYGTTELGGSGTFGTVFKITPAGALSILYNFGGGVHGGYPYAGLVQGSDGNLYGTTFSGGSNYVNCGGLICGTVFKITSAGSLTTLYSFCVQRGCTDGSNPWSGLVQGSDGNFYGTTYNGGAGSGGTVFKMTPAGSLTTLHGFCTQDGCGDGSEPISGLVQGADGNFYGTTSYGGHYTYGTAFTITSRGVLTILHGFDGNDGSGPWGGLVQAPDGFFYGTTSGGGSNHGYGTVFRVGILGACATCRP